MWWLHSASPAWKCPWEELSEGSAVVDREIRSDYKRDCTGSCGLRTVITRLTFSTRKKKSSQSIVRLLPLRRPPSQQWSFWRACNAFWGGIIPSCDSPSPFTLVVLAHVVPFHSLLWYGPDKVFPLLFFISFQYLCFFSCPRQVFKSAINTALRRGGGGRHTGGGTDGQIRPEEQPFFFSSFHPVLSNSSIYFLLPSDSPLLAFSSNQQVSPPLAPSFTRAGWSGFSDRSLVTATVDRRKGWGGGIKIKPCSVNMNTGM